MTLSGRDNKLYLFYKITTCKLKNKTKLKLIEKNVNSPNDRFELQKFFEVKRSYFNWIFCSLPNISVIFFRFVGYNIIGKSQTSANLLLNLKLFTWRENFHPWIVLSCTGSHQSIHAVYTCYFTKCVLQREL